MVCEACILGFAVLVMNAPIFMVTSIRQYREMRTPWSLGRRVTFNHGKGSYADEREEEEEPMNASIRNPSEQIIKS